MEAPNRNRRNPAGNGKCKCPFRGSACTCRCKRSTHHWQRDLWRRRTETGGIRPEMESVNALSAVPRVRADVNEVLTTGSGGHGGAEQKQEESGRKWKV